MLNVFLKEEICFFIVFCETIICFNIKKMPQMPALFSHRFQNIPISTLFPPAAVKYSPGKIRTPKSVRLHYSFLHGTLLNIRRPVTRPGSRATLDSDSFRRKSLLFGRKGRFPSRPDDLLQY